MSKCCTSLLLSFAGLTACATGPRSNAEAQSCGIALAIEQRQSNPELEACALAANAEAQGLLGMLYLGAGSSTYFNPTQRGFDESLTQEMALERGRHLIESAAANGDPAAQNELGLAHLEGTVGYDVNTVVALQWLRAATDNGDAIAPFNLARMYFAGHGVDRSTQTAEALLRLSAQRGYKPGRCSLAQWLDQSADRRLRDEAEQLRQDAARDDDGYGCYGFDIMDELLAIESSQTI